MATVPISLASGCFTEGTITKLAKRFYYYFLHFLTMIPISRPTKRI
jgi:hypothetical protein